MVGTFPRETAVIFGGVKTAMTSVPAVADRELTFQISQTGAVNRGGYWPTACPMTTPRPKWDAQLAHLLHRFPAARVVQSRTTPGAQYAVHIPRFPLGSLYNKTHTNLWVPFPVCFPVLPSGSGLFTWFDAFTDADVRYHWGSTPKGTTLASPLIDGRPTLHWRGSIRNWDDRRDGLYTLLMIVHQRLTRSRR
jgi:hypothetical protein